jgi:DNA-binding NarL/FixJ family response regulator
MNEIAVAVLADDPLTREGAAACLSAHPSILVLDAGQHEAAAVVLVIATSVTNSTLHQVELIRQASRVAEPHVVMVVDELSEQYVLRAVNSGLISLLYRADSDYDRIARAIEAAAIRRAELPHGILRHLIDQVRAAYDPATPRGLSAAGLGPRELEVLRLLSEGFTTREIGLKLNYSERMVKNIVHGIVTRFSLRNRTHAVAYALRTGML